MRVGYIGDSGALPNGRSYIHLSLENLESLGNECGHGKFMKFHNY